MKTNVNRLSVTALLLASLAFAPQAVAAPGSQAAAIVTGAPVVGSTLVADSGDWSGVSGDLTFSYDWQVCSDPADLATCESIGAADSPSYTVGASDRSQSVRVVVTATDSADAGSPVSAASAPVGPVAGPAFAGTLPTLSIADARAGEADGELSFTVSLSAPTPRTVTVAFATADGSAQAGTDYTAAAGSLTFFAGERSKTIAVAVGRDAAAEGDETLTVSLSGALNATVEDATATGTIADAAPQAAGTVTATAASAAPVAGVVRAPASALALLSAPPTTTSSRGRRATTRSPRRPGRTPSPASRAPTGSPATRATTCFAEARAATRSRAARAATRSSAARATTPSRRTTASATS